jgi:hypothetical protein
MTDNPQAALDAYLRAFEALDPEALLPFYHLPTMFIAPQGVFAAPDAGALRVLLAQFMSGLRAHSYRRTEVSGLAVHALSPGLVSCSGVFVRYDASGAEIGRPGFTYLMRENDGSWKIVVAVVHEPPTA